MIKLKCEWETTCSLQLVSSPKTNHAQNGISVSKQLFSALSKMMNIFIFGYLTVQACLIQVHMSLCYKQN